MMRLGIAIAVSVAVHLLIGLGIWLFMEYSPAPDVLATLDLSSVELSFAENEDDTAAVLPQLPAPAMPPPVPEERKPSVLAGDAAPLPTPRIPDAVDIPRPEERPEVATPDVPKPERQSEPERKVEPKPEPRPSSQASMPTPAIAPRQARIDAPPRPRRTIKPDYPKGSRQRGEQGDVLLEMVVDSNGAVDNARILTSSGFAELDDAALRAVRAARFVPAKSGGRPVVSSARIKLTFKLR